MKIVEKSTKGNGKASGGKKELGTAEKSYGLDIALNRVFIMANLPLTSRGRTDKVVIKKLEASDLNIYNRDNKIEAVKAKLTEVLA